MTAKLLVTALLLAIMSAIWAWEAWELSSPEAFQFAVFSMLALVTALLATLMFALFIHEVRNQ